MARPLSNKKNTTFRVSPALLGAMDELVKERGLGSRSDLLRVLVWEERGRLQGAKEEAQRGRLGRRRARRSSSTSAKTDAAASSSTTQGGGTPSASSPEQASTTADS